MYSYLFNPSFCLPSFHLCNMILSFFFFFLQAANAKTKLGLLFWSYIFNEFLFHACYSIFVNRFISFFQVLLFIKLSHRSPCWDSLTVCLEVERCTLARDKLVSVQKLTCFTRIVACPNAQCCIFTQAQHSIKQSPTFSSWRQLRCSQLNVSHNYTPRH